MSRVGIGEIFAPARDFLLQFDFPFEKGIALMATAKSQANKSSWQNDSGVSSYCHCSRGPSLWGIHYLLTGRYLVDDFLLQCNSASSIQL
jgi:hypothetical protein